MFPSLEEVPRQGQVTSHPLGAGRGDRAGARPKLEEGGSWLLRGGGGMSSCPCLCLGQSSLSADRTATRRRSYSWEDRRQTRRGGEQQAGKAEPGAKEGEPVMAERGANTNPTLPGGYGHRPPGSARAQRQDSASQEPTS